MEAVKLAGFAMAAALMALTLRTRQPQLGLAMSMAAGVMLLVWTVREMSGVVETMNRLTGQVSLQGGMLKMIMKVMGVSYLTEFAAQTCRQAGEEGLSQKVLLAGKVLVLGLAMPAAGALIQLILALAP